MDNWLRLRARLDEAGTSGAGGSGSSGTQQPPPTPQGDQQQPPPTPNPQQPSSDQGTKPPEGYVPADQLRAVAAERDRLAREKQEREEADQKAKGEFEAIAQKREQERDEWKARFTTTARRSAFIAKIAAQVADPEAAYKLAQADGLLKDVKVDDDGNADAKAIDEAVKTTTDTYKFLKSAGGSFGGERSGQHPDSGPDLAKMSPRERMEYGIAQDTRARAGR